jgi:hypothetical protein
MAEHADRVIDLPASHSPFLSMPQRLAAVLTQAAPATADDRPSGNHDDHDLRLEY